MTRNDGLFRELNPRQLSRVPPGPGTFLTFAILLKPDLDFRVIFGSCRSKKSIVFFNSTALFLMPPRQLTQRQLLSYVWPVLPLLIFRRLVDKLTLVKLFYLSDAWMNEGDRVRASIQAKKRDILQTLFSFL